MAEEDLYGGGPTLAEAPAPDAMPPETEQAATGQSFLINQDVAPGLAVGDEIRSRIVAVHEKEYECEPITEEAPEEMPPETMGEEPPGSGLEAGEAGGSLYG